MHLNADTEVSLFVRDRKTGRLVFNSEAIRALGLSPVELKQRGYELNGEIANPTIVPDDGPISSDIDSTGGAVG